MRNPICWLTCLGDLKCPHYTIERRVLGATLGWGMRPAVRFQWIKRCRRWGGSSKSTGILPGDIDREEFPRNENDWPLDPETGEKLPISI